MHHAPSPSESSSKDRSVAAAAAATNVPIEEHTWDLERVAREFSSSGIRTAGSPRSGVGSASASPTPPPTNGGVVARPTSTSTSVSASGLPLDEIEPRRARFGRNMLTPPPKIPQWLLFLKQFTDLFQLMLIAAGALSLVAFALDTSATLNLWLAIVLFAVVFFTCCLSYVQERKTSKLMDLFSGMTPKLTTVVRDNGQSSDVDASELVVGDIVRISGGEIVPADLRLISCSSLRVECSSLTGESAPIACVTDAYPEGTPPHEAKCLAFSGSICLQGEATGVVVRTGDNTMIGQIATITNQAGANETTLGHEIKRFVRFVAVLAFLMALIFFVIGVARTKGSDTLNFFVNGFLIVIVANVPQGLPATVTSMLTITARRMAGVNVFVKKLESIETLGSASVIASDKTGTITQNRMTMRELWCNGSTLSKSFAQYFPRKGNPLSRDADSDEAERMILGMRWSFVVAAVCNRAERASPPASPDPLESLNNSMESPSMNRSSGMSPAALAVSEDDFKGSPSDVALRCFVERVRQADDFKVQFETIFEVPFNSTNKWHLLICRPRTVEALELAATLPAPDTEGRVDTSSATLGSGKEPHIMLLKGAPEVILRKCSFHVHDNQIQPANEAFQRRFDAALRGFGNNARRVIGLCAQVVAQPVADAEYAEQTAPDSGYVFLGLAALADPPRPNAREAVEQCRSAGVRVFMVTGDYAATARAIAKEVGIISAEDLEEVERAYGKRELPGQQSPGVYLSSAVNEFSREDWQHVLRHKGAVFARATPQQKLTIVKACQREGEIVAVTGDGVNDAPALKQADIGVAMGLKGSAVAREAADALLMDDNFASIVAGIKEGRLIIDNLRKTIRYVLTHLLPEIVPVLLNLSLGLPLGLLPLQILSIDLGTEMALGITLAYEPAEPGIMSRPPRRRSEPLVTRELLIYSYLIAGVVEAIGCFLAYTQVYHSFGLSLSDIIFNGDDSFQPNADPICIDGECYSTERQEFIAGTATSAWYITLILSQALHIFLVKSAHVSVFRLNPLNNFVTLYGVVSAILIMLLLVYVPGIQTVMGSRDPNDVSWLFFLGVVFVLLVYTETALSVRKRREKKAEAEAEAVAPLQEVLSVRSSSVVQSPPVDDDSSYVAVANGESFGPGGSTSSADGTAYQRQVSTRSFQHDGVHGFVTQL